MGKLDVSIQETFLQDFLKILKRMLQKFKKILKKYTDIFYATECIPDTRKIVIVSETFMFKMNNIHNKP